MITSNSFKKIHYKAVTLFLLVLVLLPNFVFADASYDFESDAIGATPAGVTVTAGTFDVQNDDLLGKSMRAVTQVGVIAGVIFDDFGTSSDQSVVWKQAYSSNLGRSGFTLRAQDTDTGVINSVGAKQGYLFHVYSSGSVYIWEVGPSSYTALWSGSLSKAEPRWFRASAVGDDLTFEYSDNGSSYTTLATVSDTTYTSGKVQYTAGYGSSVGVDYVDDINITNLDSDTSNPTVDTFSPSDNATGVSTSGNISITFSENVDAETGSVDIYRTLDNSLVESIDVTSGQVTGSGTNTITINPSQNLAESTAFYVQIDATAFDDTAGNSFAGISDSTTWNFTTGEFTNPTLETLSPSDNATNVAVNTDLVITFSEAVTSQNGNVSVYKSEGDILVEDINVASGQVTGTGTDTITIDISEPLENGTAYYVQIDATAFDDTAGNSFAGISDSATWNFTTVSQQRNTSSSGTYRGCKDPKALNYEKFSAHRQELCEYATEKIDTAITSVDVRDLTYGMKGEDVRQLQLVLIAEGYQILAGPTGLFLNQTQSALKEYQKKHNVMPAAGYFGPITRGVMKSLQTPDLWW